MEDNSKLKSGKLIRKDVLNACICLHLPTPVLVMLLYLTKVLKVHFEMWNYAKNVLVLMVTNFSAEISFYKTKIIKNRLLAQE